ncbi:hypothetical protein ACKLKD_22835 [Klebsiella sp. 10982]|uniref:hypothetical protein n=1 Tax=Klebsiella TaxID=570 RepID=UPI00104CC665|nr:hypothetical protein [Klebsiella quasivariicola]MBK2373741.1 hypothetical protein [Klebsiella quasivariicola]MCL7688214.1 hypothetical protein [Klebsiella quasivariicola]QBL47822.1 hypothetical protein BMD99_004180 [Klebsiella sp. PO552]
MTRSDYFHGGATLTVATVICRLEIPWWRCAYRGYGYLPPGNPTVALRLPWLRLSAAWKSHGGAALTVATILCGLVARLRRKRRKPGTVP